jgi:hypothetical protein
MVNTKLQSWSLSLPSQKILKENTKNSSVSPHPEIDELQSKYENCSIEG